MFGSGDGGVGSAPQGRSRGSFIGTQICPGSERALCFETAPLLLSGLMNCKIGLWTVAQVMIQDCKGMAVNRTLPLGSLLDKRSSPASREFSALLRLLIK